MFWKRRKNVLDNRQTAAPDSMAARAALWRALHIQVDPAPHVFEDEVGLKLVAPDEGWRHRPDMEPQDTRHSRASVVARARFIEDLVVEQAGRAVSQYVILGAGLDSFAQRRPKIASHLKVFELDQPGPQAWKRQRLIELGFGIPEWLSLVPANFEDGKAWWRQLVAAGFEPGRPAIVASNGISMYVTKKATVATLRQVEALAPGSTFVMTYLPPLEMAKPDARSELERATEAARASGTPFISFFHPIEMLKLVRATGFQKGYHITAAGLALRYFKGRTDGLRPLTNSEEVLVAGT